MPEYFVAPGVGGTPWLKTKELDDRIIEHTEEHITAEAISASSAKMLPKGTVAMAMYGATVGQLGILGKPMTCNQAVCAMVVDETKADNRFLFYSLLHNRDAIINLAVGSAQQNLSGQVIKNLRLPFPDLAEQRRIADVLGALDDLIEMNRRLVGNLLATVNAEFERRFGLRELSLRLDALASVTDCLHSKKPERVTSRHRLLQLSNILDSGQLDTGDMYGITAEDYRRWTKNIETREWDCVITNVGRVGAVARIPAGVAAALGRNMTAIRPKAPDGDGAFILAALLSRPVRREITLKTDSGTVMDALNVKNIPSLRLPQASPGERSEFHAFARPLLLAADSLKNEVTEIQATRDELLPLLMSGRVRVTEDVAA